MTRVLLAICACLSVFLACPASDPPSDGNGEGEGEGEGEGDVSLALCDYDAAPIDTCGFEEPASCPDAPPQLRTVCPTERLGCAYCRTDAPTTPVDAVVCDLGTWIPDEEGCIE